jgi:hypothetical protein
VPLALERIVGYCLEKDASLRLQSAHDLAIALEALSGSWSAIEPPRASGRSRWHPALDAAAAALVIGVPAYCAGVSRLPATRLPDFTRVTFQTAFFTGAKFLPEETGVIYSAELGRAEEQLFMTRLGSPGFSALGGPSTRLAGISRGGELAVLRKVVLNQPGQPPAGILARMPATGGAPRDVLEGVEAADWSPDGTTFVVVRTVEGRRRLEFPIGTTRFETGGWIDAPRVSPDAKRIAFVEHPLPFDDRGWVSEIEIATGRATRLTGELDSLRGIEWHPVTGEVWYGTDRRIDAIRGDGTIQTVARSTEPNYLYDIASDGRLLVRYFTQELRTRLLLPSGEQRDLTWLDGTWPIMFWPSGDRLLFWEALHYGVYARALDGSPAVRLGDGTGLALSPDGRSALAAQHTDPMRLAIYPTGAGDTRFLPTPGIQRIISGTWTPRGDAVVFDAEDQSKTVRIYTQALAGGGPTPIGAPGVRLLQGVNLVSPDGAFVLTLGRAGGVLLQPLDGGDARTAKGLRGTDVSLDWEPDGRTLIVEEDGLDWPVRLVRVDPFSGTRVAWRDATPVLDVRRSGTPPLALSRDHRTIAFMVPEFRSTLYTVNFEEAK